MDFKQLARELVENAVVLLKNEGNLLPMPNEKTVAFFGRAQWKPILSGNGSGAVHGACSAIITACESAGLCPVLPLAEFYRSQADPVGEDGLDWSNLAAMAKLVHSGEIYEYFGQYRTTPDEPEIPEKLMTHAAAQTDTAVIILGRCAGGEECDRHLQDDYYLSKREITLIGNVCAAFSHVVLVLNINGWIDLAWLEEYPAIESILFLGIPGECGPEALARILSGTVNPSGKLAVTIARRYEDYPCAEHFSWDKEHLEHILDYDDYGLNTEENGKHTFAKRPVTVYQEGIYTGYRYFDTFQVKPLFPFGFGLSYTTFSLTTTRVVKAPEGLSVSVQVTNTGDIPGRETVQLYLIAVGSDCPIKTLQGFEKTALLQPGDSGIVTISIPWRALASYDENLAAWVIAQGAYHVLIGQDSSCTHAAAAVTVDTAILVQQCRNCLSIQPANRKKLQFLNHEKVPQPDRITPWAFSLTMADMPANRQSQQKDAQDLAEFSLEELATLCVGYGPGIPFSSYEGASAPSSIMDGQGHPLTQSDHATGLPGYVSPAIPVKGIHSISYMDGPAGVGLTAWPSEMLLACSFDKSMCYRFGDAIGSECESRHVDVWLAPAVNLHRHPLCGRNFEYLSEDPFLTGSLACAIARGVEENHPVLTCPKHFAANEQETFRRGSTRMAIDAADSILPERVLRELYLKPFEMLVRDVGIHCIMTSFNKINGVFSAGSYDLCTRILREEWGFDGMVVTDWGDMDTVVDGADAIKAGNDIIMPGGPPVIGQILKGIKEGRLYRSDLEAAVRNLLFILQKTGKRWFDWAEKH